jgi:antitoxin ParD1/3/4
MATMNISLPDELKEWVEAQSSSGNFGNTSDYMRHILRKEQDRLAYVAWMDAEIEKGIASGFVELTVDDAFARANAKAEALLAKKKVS